MTDIGDYQDREIICVDCEQPFTWWARTMMPETIYIHASKNFPRWAKDLCETKMFSRVLSRHGYDSPEDLPTAGIIGSVNVLGSLPTEAIRDRLSPQELAFGDYDTGRIAIRLARPRGFDMLFRCKGALGLWTVPGDVERHIISAGVNIPVPAGAVQRVFVEKYALYDKERDG